MKRIMTSSSQSIAQTSTAQADTADSSTIMKRVWAFLLALVLCIGLMPSFAWADEGDEDGDGTTQAEEEGEGEGENDGNTMNANPYDADAASELLNNLETRFSTGGTDSELTNDTVYAAIALDMLGKGDQINKEGVLKTLNEYEETNGSAPTAGALAKYIFALTAADENCKAVSDGDETRDLVKDMEDLVDKEHMDVYSAVWILGVYPYGGYEQGETCEMSIEELAQFVIDNQNEEGLFGAEGYEDTQTTAQAIYALDLYYMGADDGTNEETATKAKEAAEKAEKALLDYQNEDGGFKLSKDSSESDIDATANIATALKIDGYDVASLESSDDSKNLATADGSSPIGYLTATADETLDGYTTSGTYNEAMTSSTVFMALAADAANVNLDNIDANSAESNSEGTTTAGYSPSSGSGGGSGGSATPASASTTPTSGSGTTSSSTPSSSSSNPSSGSTLAKTGDADTAGVAGIALVALCGALVCALVAARCMRTNRDSARH